MATADPEEADVEPAEPAPPQGRSWLLTLAAVGLLVPLREGRIPRGDEVVRAGVDAPLMYAWLVGGVVALAILTWVLRGRFVATAADIARRTSVTPARAAGAMFAACLVAVVGLSLQLGYHPAGFSVFGLLTGLAGVAWWSAALGGPDRIVAPVALVVQIVGLLYFAMVLGVIPGSTAAAALGDAPYTTQTVLQFGAYFAVLAAFWVHRDAPRRALPAVAVVAVLSLFAAGAQLGWLEPLQPSGTVKFPLSRLLEASCGALTAIVGAHAAAKVA